jgi:hypothetical protein
VLEAHAMSIRHLEALIDLLSALGATSTSTLLSSPEETRENHARQIESFANYFWSQDHCMRARVRAVTCWVALNRCTA